MIYLSEEKLASGYKVKIKMTYSFRMFMTKSCIVKGV